ncbi:efflux transporter, outer membrane factor (OMF) lipoprotein, NodT family [Myxococcus fulvus]|uniref:Efflux transporter, outer membrane factor (OMF) lipoprotein, NodT family n=1 Tax=Myxococcus fulvus TaxID=33 RepID=A0A511T996_MYXFU|nr:efflux transporter outer membrane subunit [Myxococcus fulvus]GEN10052.1 outer membrane efflux protein [Myxococcus fulvus]SEU25069.1 efflux transporter, outer membrane factor (OMF) lipoprotein, NodT family [Myxococcus fulvus]
MFERRRWGWLRAWAVLVASGGVSGCPTRAPPRGPEVLQQALAHTALATAWTSPGAPEGGIQDGWLASFQDEQLQALVKEALSRNPDLRSAAARVDQASAMLGVARAGLLPTVDLEAKESLGIGQGLEGVLRGIDLSAGWEIDLWGKLRYRRNAARETMAAAEADFEFARQSLAATLAKGWLLVTEAHLLRCIAVERVAMGEELVKLTTTRLQVGVISEHELSLALANLDSYRDTVKQLELTRVQAARAVELLAGRYPAGTLEPRDSLVELPGPVPAGIPASVLERRPDLMAAERRVAAAFNRVQEARAARLPSLRLTGAVGLVDSDVVVLKDTLTNPTGGVAAGLLAPLFHGGALAAQVRARTAEQEAALGAYASAALRATNEVENALSSERILGERREILERAVAAHGRALELLTVDYRVGKVDLRTLLQQTLLADAARISLLRVRSEQLIQRINLHLALGGGFAVPAEPKPAEK